MYDFSEIIPETHQELYELVSDLDIFYFYFGEFDEGAYYASPFPWREDSSPSFTITYYNEEWVFRDFGISVKPYSAWYYPIVYSNHQLSYKECLRKIYFDVYLSGKFSANPNYDKASLKAPTTKKFDLGLKLRRQFKDFELLYWKQANITQDILHRFKVYACDGLWKDSELMHYSTKYDPFFVYLFDRDSKIWKTYRPKARKKFLKFHANNVSGHIQGLDLLPEEGGDILFITKSYKDVMVLFKLGFDAIAPHTESTFLAAWDIDYLKSIYTYIYVWYDNDQTGKEKSNEFAKLYNLRQIFVPDDLINNYNNKPIKDPFDVVIYDKLGYDYLEEEVINQQFLTDGIQ